MFWLRHQTSTEDDAHSFCSKISVSIQTITMKTSSCGILASAILFAADGEAAPRSLRSPASTEVNKSKNHVHRDESSLTVVS